MLQPWWVLLAVEAVIQVLLIKNCFMRSQNLNCLFLYYIKVANVRDDNSSILGLGGISLSEVTLL